MEHLNVYYDQEKSDSRIKRGGRPFKGSVEEKNQKEDFACYRKSIIRSLCKILKKLHKYSLTKTNIKAHLKLLRPDHFIDV